MANEIGIKQGATFELLIAGLNDDDSPFDFTRITVTAQVRDAQQRLIDDLALVSVDSQSLSVLHQTANWPVGRLVCDFKVVDDATGTILKSDTFGIQVAQAVTT
jgi:hypothetical protein